MLPRTRPPIHQHILPRHPPARPRTQKQHRPLQLLRRPDPPEHRLPLKLRHQPRLLPLQPPHHVRHRISGRQGVHADPVLGEFHRQGFHEPPDGGLRGRVARDALRGGGDVGCDAGDEDDGAVDWGRGVWGCFCGVDFLFVGLDYGVGAGLGDEEGACELFSLSVFYKYSS